MLNFSEWLLDWEQNQLLVFLWEAVKADLSSVIAKQTNRQFTELFNGKLKELGRKPIPPDIINWYGIARFWAYNVSGFKAVDLAYKQEIEDGTHDIIAEIGSALFGNQKGQLAHEFDELIKNTPDEQMVDALGRMWNGTCKARSRHLMNKGRIGNTAVDRRITNLGKISDTNKEIDLSDPTPQVSEPTQSQIEDDEDEVDSMKRRVLRELEEMIKSRAPVTIGKKETVIGPERAAKIMQIATFLLAKPPHFPKYSEVAEKFPDVSPGTLSDYRNIIQQALIHATQRMKWEGLEHESKRRYRLKHDAEQPGARNSGVPGITWSKAKERWLVQIQINGKIINGGSYRPTEDGSIPPAALLKRQELEERKRREEGGERPAV